MKAVPHQPYLYVDVAGIYHCRRRIPLALLPVSSNRQRERLISLRTRDRRVALERLRGALTQLDTEFARLREVLQVRDRGLARQCVSTLSDPQIAELSQRWAHAVLSSDEERRRRGLPEDEFLALGESLSEQRRELGALLARGNVSPIIPALRGFLYLCGMEPALDADSERLCAYRFLQALVGTLDKQCARQAGAVVETEGTAPNPVTSAAAPIGGAGWDEIFDAWRTFVSDRPRSTEIAFQTAYRALRRHVTQLGVTGPQAMTAEIVASFVTAMGRSGLNPKTINSRLTNLRTVFRIAVGRQLLARNPFDGVLGYGISARERRQRTRLPFSDNDLRVIFGSPIYIHGARSQGQVGEASYWLPLLMLYTGARPEELAGMPLADVRQRDDGRWCLHISDLADDVLGAGGAGVGARRRLKTAQSRRVIPIARELVALGFLRYVEWVRGRGMSMLFPTLRQDAHGKYSGAFIKVFGRYLRGLGIVDPRKVLYSFRHTFKDLLERARIPSKHLQRLLGHASGDGTVTDGYGSDEPIQAAIFEYFDGIVFPGIPALPWQPPGDAGTAPSRSRTLAGTNRGKGVAGRMGSRKPHPTEGG